MLSTIIALGTLFIDRTSTTTTPACPDYSNNANPCNDYSQDCCPTENGLCQWNPSQVCAAEGGPNCCELVPETTEIPYDTTEMNVYSTEFAETTEEPTQCVESMTENGCAGMADGQYQSCYGCRVYVRCINGITYDWTKCPWNAAGTNRLQWDDKEKECVEESSTCEAKDTTTLGPQKPDTTEAQPDTTEQPYDTTEMGIFTTEARADTADPDTTEMDTTETLSTTEEPYDTTMEEPYDITTEEPYDTTTEDYDTTMEEPYDTTMEEPTTTKRKPPPRPECITSCYDDTGNKLKDGNYQSCQGCCVYASCVAGNIIERPCPDKNPSGRLVWDDRKKVCTYKSQTCDEETDTTQVPLDTTEQAYDTTDMGIFDIFTTEEPPKRPECVESLSENGCAGMADGNYQSCYGCRVYVRCINGITYDWTKCPWNAAGTNRLQWDDKEKECIKKSNTCNVKDTTTLGPVIDTTEPAYDTTDMDIFTTEGQPDTTEPETTQMETTEAEEYPCIKSCKDDNGNSLFDGDYQSCKGCTVYASCVNGRMYGRRKCPGQLVWDDKKKSCGYESETCTDGDGSGNILANEKGTDEETLDTTDGAVSVYGSSKFLFLFVIIAYLLL